jgi:hypothetical protein
MRYYRAGRRWFQVAAGCGKSAGFAAEKVAENGGIRGGKTAEKRRKNGGIRGVSGAGQKISQKNFIA